MLDAVPSDKHVLKELANLEKEMEGELNAATKNNTTSIKPEDSTKGAHVEASDYLPMRVGPMTFEEIVEPEAATAKTPSPHPTKITWKSMAKEKPLVPVKIAENSINKQ